VAGVNISNPIVQRELVGLLRSPRALAVQVGPAVVLAVLVLARWPNSATVGLTGVQALEVFRLFAYGLLATVVLLVPIFPATSLVREKQQGTLALLLNSPLGQWSIYFGKLAGVAGFTLLPLVASLPAAAACYAMGGLSLVHDVAALYVVLLLAALQYAALGLLVSSCATTNDGALRATFALVLLLAVLVLGPYQFLQGWPDGAVRTTILWLRCLSPIPAVMEIVDQGDLSGRGLVTGGGAPGRFLVLGVLSTAAFMIATATRLRQTMFDRPRPQGLITDQRSAAAQRARRLMFLVDPQRRKGAIGNWVNPVMVKEFRTRRFGRSHWMLRLIAGCALISLLLTYAATAGTFAWGVETIGGIMVLLQVALIVLLTPSLAAGLISAEHETGGWVLLRMTPLSAGRIVLGKLVSVLWTLVLILLATLPGYLVMIFIQPVLTQQILYVLTCLVLAALFALLVSAAISSLYRRTAPATITAYALLLLIFGGTLLIWLGRGAPFGHGVVQTALTVNSLAAALSVLEVEGFAGYQLVPANWWVVLVACAGCLLLLIVQTWRMTRPQ